ncbi:MAG TPA: ATP-binding protein, partial [Polyangiaceae bacterium]|nr:ATP-binding protein [Polyangiaceae bacterium]
MTPQDHEQKVRELFREEALEHFETIQRALYAAESDPALGAERLQMALRAAHSIKGAARLTGLLELESIVHNWESCASLLLTGKLELEGRALELLMHVLEVAQEELEFQYFNSPRRVQPAAVFAEISAHFGAQAELRAPGVSEETSAQLPSSAKGATIRVATHKLDRQMASIEELLRLRVATELRLAELGRLLGAIGRWHVGLTETRQIIRQKRNGSAPLREIEATRVATLLEEQWKSAEQVQAEASQLHAKCRRTCDELSATTETLRDDVRAVRMLPVEDALMPFVRMVRELGRSTGKQVVLNVTGGDTEVDRDVLESIKDPVMHLLRNSVDHGIEEPAERARLGKPAKAELGLHARSRAGILELEICDDGRGIARKNVEQAALYQGLVSSEQLSRMDDSAVRALIFQDGFSTAQEVSELSGRGVGLAVARSAVEKLGGRIMLRSDEGKGTSFTLVLPLTLATSRLLLVEIGSELFALPSASVDRVIRVELAQLTRIDRGFACDVDGRPVQVFRLAEALRIETTADPRERMFGVVLGGTTGRAVCLVDRVFDEQELVARGLGDELRSVPNVSGVALLADGRIVPILSSADLLKNSHSLAEAPVRGPAVKAERARRVLVVDDSVTTRTLEKSILEAAGYE